MKKCPNCGFKPTTEEAKAKSLILSNDYWIDGEYRGKSDEELLAIGEAIRTGHLYQFDDAEVAWLMDYAQMVFSIPKRTLILEFFRFSLPVLIVGGVLVAYYLTQP